ncbi:MAG: type II toxin-antitoxin system HigB family toxin, partial [Hyphomonas sp.]|nr:type II toxin-antitoxin system HigB family toxin [Hyphomonas sp.]
DLVPTMGTRYIGHADMRIIAIKALKDFWKQYPDSEEALKSWYSVTAAADWKSPNEVKETYGNASILQDGRVVFNAAGNKYRLIVWINYPYRVVYIRFVGTHAQYDNIDAQTI